MRIRVYCFNRYARSVCRAYLFLLFCLRSVITHKARTAQTTITGAGVKGLSCVAGDFPRGRQLRCDNELCTSLGVTMQ